MERWNGKVAVVTGASSGIGWAIVNDLLSAKMIVIGLARRLDQMNKLKEQLSVNVRSSFFPWRCDLNSLISVKSAFEWIEKKFQRVHVLINNAGIAEFSNLLDEGNEEILARIVNVNLMGSVFCTKEAFRLMKIAMAGNEECHIVNVNSLLGHRVPLHIPEHGFNLYPVVKHALNAMNEVLRRELFPNKLIRLSTISPGLTQTNFGANFAGSEREGQMPMPKEILLPEDVSRGVIFIISSPIHVTIESLIMVPSREEY